MGIVERNTHVRLHRITGIDVDIRLGTECQSFGRVRLLLSLDFEQPGIDLDLNQPDVVLLQEQYLSTVKSDSSIPNAHPLSSKRSLSPEHCSSPLGAKLYRVSIITIAALRLALCTCNHVKVHVPGHLMCLHDVVVRNVFSGS